MIKRRNRKRPYAERTRACDRTISVRKSAGTKRPRNYTSPYVESNTEFNAPAMNLGPNSNFLDIDDVFGGSGSGLRRAMSGAPTKKIYT